MALSGSSSTAQISTIGCQFYFEWSATQSIEDNTSTVTVILYSARYSSGGYFTGSWNKNSYKVGGNASGVITAAGVPQGSTQYQWIEQSRWTTTISHNSDGTKAGLVIQARAYQTSPATYDETLSVTVTLDTIPRATEITAFSSITLTTSSPTSITATLDRKSTSFTHTISLSVNGTKIKDWTGANPTLSLTNANRLAMLAAIPDKGSASMSLTVVTKNASGTTIGTRSKSATCTVSTSIVPAITGVSVSISTPKGAISSKNRSYAVRNVSNVSISYTSTGGSGSPIASEIVKFGNKTVSGNPAVAKIDASGSVTITITATDKRGRSSTSTKSVTVYDYTKLSARLAYLGRPLSGAQDRLSAKLKLTVAPITYGGATTNAYNVKIVATPVAGGSSITSVDTTTNPGTASNQTISYDPTNAHSETAAYSVVITVKDDFSTATIYGTLSTSAYPLVIGEIGIGVGGVPQTGRVLDVYDDANKGIFVNGKILPADFHVANNYPSSYDCNGIDYPIQYAPSTAINKPSGVSAGLFYQTYIYSTSSGWLLVRQIGLEAYNANVWTRQGTFSGTNNVWTWTAWRSV